MRTLLLTVVLLVVVWSRSESQATVGPRGASQQGDTARAGQPKTKFEPLQARSGSVIVMGFESAAEVKCAITAGTLNVESRELLDAGSGRKEYGIAVEVEKYGQRTTRSYVDADEIESLLKGLDYVAKADKSVTALANFQADYRTRGSLRISAFNNTDKLMLAVETEAPCGSTCYLNMDQAPASTGGGVPFFETSTILLRTDVLKLIRQGKYGVPIGDQKMQACQIVYHERLHLWHNYHEFNGPDQDHGLIDPLVKKSHC